MKDKIDPIKLAEEVRDKISPELETFWGMMFAVVVLYVWTQEKTGVDFADQYFAVLRETKLFSMTMFFELALGIGVVGDGLRRIHRDRIWMYKAWLEVFVLDRHNQDRQGDSKNIE